MWSSSHLKIYIIKKILFALSCFTDIIFSVLWSSKAAIMICTPGSVFTQTVNLYVRTKKLTAVSSNSWICTFCILDPSNFWKHTYLLPVYNKISFISYREIYGGILGGISRPYFHIMYGIPPKWYWRWFPSSIARTYSTTRYILFKNQWYERFFYINFCVQGWYEIPLWLHVQWYLLPTIYHSLVCILGSRYHPCRE